MAWEASDTVAVVAIAANVVQFAIAQGARSIEKRSEKREAAQAEALTVTAQAHSIFTASRPDDIRDAQQTVPRLKSEWDALRPAIVALATSHRHSSVRDAARDLYQAGDESMLALHDMFLEPTRTSEFDEKKSRMNQAHTSAYLAVSELLNEVVGGK